MERPTLAEDSLERRLLRISNHVFTTVFLMEMMIKGQFQKFSSKFSNFFFEIFKNFFEFPLKKFLVMALGFYCGSDAYLRSGWNVLDFSLVVCSIVDTLFVLVSKSSPKILGILRVFRLLRTLRPLRVISRAPGLKLVVQEIVANIGSINYSLIR